MEQTSWKIIEGFNGKYETDGNSIRNSKSKKTVNPRTKSGREYYRLVKPDGKKCERSFYRLTGIGKRRKRRNKKFDMQYVDEICLEYKKGESTYSISKKYGICRATVTKILAERGIKPVDLLEQRICRECGNEFIVGDIYNGRGKVPTFCSEKCRKRHAARNSAFKRRERLKGTENINLADVFSNDNGICYLCGKAVDTEDYEVNENGIFKAGNNYPSIDHVIPLAKGGKNTIDNVRLAHRLCNSIKGAS